MLVSHQYKFIYTKTVKTAGTSVEAYFERFCMPEGEWTPSHQREEYVSPTGVIGNRGRGARSKARARQITWWNHMPAREIKAILGEDVWRSYFKFCTIRNPYEKAISAFFFFTRTKPPDERPPPTQFEEWLAKPKALPRDRDKYTIGGKICMDDFIRVESLQADLERVCRRLGVPWRPEDLPKLKVEFRPAWASAERLFTPRSRARVEEAFDFELRTFGYEFPAKPEDRST